MYECTGTMYRFTRAITRAELFAVAEEALAARYAAGEAMTSPETAGKYMQLKLAEEKAESFVVMFLNTRHRLIATEVMFRGGVDSAEVHPREVVRRALELGAAACLLGHNHPSGDSEPSSADRAITARLREALSLFDVRLLDHFVVGRTVTSMAARGWL